MKPYNIIYSGFAFFLAAFACGCSDSDDWTPGQEDNETGVSAFFTMPEKTSYIFDIESPAEDIGFDVVVERSNTAEAVEIPVVLEANTTGITLPSAVSFAAGESLAAITVNCAGIEGGKYETFSIVLPDDQTDIYGIGMNKVTFTVIKARWLVVSDKVRYIYSDLSYSEIYPSTYGKMYNLEGTGLFRLDDFLGSGLSVMFECTDPEGSTFCPLNNADFETTAGQADSPWYVFNDETGKWPMWVPGNLTGYNAIAYLEFFASDVYSKGIMISDKETMYGYYSLTGGLTFEDGSFTWCSFMFDFTLNYNPFENN